MTSLNPVYYKKRCTQNFKNSNSKGNLKMRLLMHRLRAKILGGLL